MLHQELPAIADRPLDGGGRWLLPGLGGAAVLSLAAIWLLVGPIPALVLAGLAGGRGGRRRGGLAPTGKRSALPKASFMAARLRPRGSRARPVRGAGGHHFVGRRAARSQRSVSPALRRRPSAQASRGRRIEPVAADGSLHGLARWSRLRCGGRDACRNLGGGGAAGGPAQRSCCCGAIQARRRPTRWRWPFRGFPG